MNVAKAIRDMKNKTRRRKEDEEEASRKKNIETVEEKPRETAIFPEGAKTPVPPTDKPLRN